MRKKWIGGIVAAFIVGAAIGAAGADDSGQLKSVQATSSKQGRDLRAQLSGARAEREDAEHRAVNASDRADRAEHRAHTAEQRARRKVRRQFADREGQLDARAAELDARERKVSGMEHDWKANSIPGDGRFRVGSDVAPGIYQARSAGSGNCYWARMGADTGSIDDIIENGNVAGPVTITVGAADHMLELSGCSTFHKVG